MAGGKGNYVNRAYKKIAKTTQKKDHAKVVKLTSLVKQPTLRSTSCFPPTMRVKQRYFDYWSTDGTVIGKMFNINSVFDPDRTGTGHKPNGSTNLIAIYNKYRVHNARIVCNFTATSSTAFIGFVSPVNNGTTMLAFYGLMESPGTKKKTVSYNGTGCTLKLNASCAAIAGVSKLTYEADDIYAALTTSNPGEIMTFQVCASKVDGTALAAGTVYVEIMIEYDVTYYDGSNIGLS